MRLFPIYTTTRRDKSERMKSRKGITGRRRSDGDQRSITRGMQITVHHPLTLPGNERSRRQSVPRPAVCLKPRKGDDDEDDSLFMSFDERGLTRCSRQMLLMRVGRERDDESLMFPHHEVQDLLLLVLWSAPHVHDISDSCSRSLSSSS